MPTTTHDLEDYGPFYDLPSIVIRLSFFRDPEDHGPLLTTFYPPYFIPHNLPHFPLPWRTTSTV